MGGESGGNAERPGGNCNCGQGETSVDWHMSVVEDYEGGKGEEGEREECSTESVDARGHWDRVRE